MEYPFQYVHGKEGNTICRAIMVPSDGKMACTSGKNIYHNNKKLKCIYNQSSKTYYWMFGEDSEKRKNNALPIPPNPLQSSWPAVPLCTPTIVLWIGKDLLFMSTSLTANKRQTFWTVFWGFSGVRQPCTSIKIILYLFLYCNTLTAYDCRGTIWILNADLLSKIRKLLAELLVVL